MSLSSRKVTTQKTEPASESKQASEIKQAPEVIQALNEKIINLEKELDLPGNITIESKSEPRHYTIKVKLSETTRGKIDELLETKNTMKESSGDDSGLNKGAYNKNFQKKFGDLFCWFLRDQQKIKVSTKFMDNLSWARINKYLRGDAPFGEMDIGALNNFMIAFVISTDKEKFNGNKIRDEVCKLVYRTRFTALKKGMLEVKALLDGGFELSYMQIVKCWPHVVIQLYPKNEKQLPVGAEKKEEDS